MKLKRLDVFVLKSFLQPFAATFFISLLVLLMQFLWKYIDDLAGKGLEWYVIMEFMVYASANIINMALPLAILLASIMTMGNLGERYELVSIKAAGIPLKRVFRPLVFVVALLSVFAFWFSIEVVPVANLKWGALYYDVMQQKPAFDLKEGVFYKDIKDYSIKIAEKSKDGKEVKEVIIYDHTQGRGNTTVIVAEKGEISYSNDKRYLFFNLFNGTRYEEMINQPDFYDRQQFNSMSFKEQQVVFDLSGFSMSRTDLDLFKDYWKYKRMPDLEAGIKQLNHEIDSNVKRFEKQFYDSYHFRKDSLVVVDPNAYKIPTQLSLDSALILQRKAITTQALLLARTMNGHIEWSAGEIRPIRELHAKHLIVWWSKFTLAVACLVLFFIGAPLGAIVRKGGFGLPVVFAIIFFMIYFILNIMGEKTVRELIIPPFWGMWLSAFVLSPLGFWLTVKATRDSTLFDMDAYTRWFRKWFKKKAET